MYEAFLYSFSVFYYVSSFCKGWYVTLSCNCKFSLNFLYLGLMIAWKIIRNMSSNWRYCKVCAGILNMYVKSCIVFPTELILKHNPLSCFYVTLLNGFNTLCILNIGWFIFRLCFAVRCFLWIFEYEVRWMTLNFSKWK